MPHGCVISIPAIPDSHRCIRTSVVALGVEVCYIHIGVGAQFENLGELVKNTIFVA
jgi:hypothetical protein